ncbi:hypothetical protein bcgnr5390_09900 [Bacillus luti]|nr:hypothetical protein BC2903_31010 [Bacillus cereus]
MIVLCIEDVFMNSDVEKCGKVAGKQAFTKGKEYKARRFATTLEDPYKLTELLRVTNDFGERHSIKICEEGADNSFFHKHFQEVKR